MRQISAKELQQRLQEAPVTILDVREPWEYQKSHIEGSVHIPMGQIPQRHNELSPDQEIVVMCHHGMRSLQVSQYLEKTGFTNIANLAGGIDAWARDVDSNIPTY